MTQSQQIGAHSVRTADLALPANCHTITRAGMTGGIVMSTNRGPDQLRPWKPHALIGGHRIHRDYFTENGSPVGAVYHPNQGSKTAVLRRATLQERTAKNGKVFHTLRRPIDEKPSFSLLKVDFGLPKGFRMVKGGHTLRIHAGIGGSATVVSQSNTEALVMVPDGEVLVVFFPDGFVVEFHQEGGRLTQRSLNLYTMAVTRIEDAHGRLVEAMQGKTLDESLDAVRPILSGMADLIHVTSVAGASAQDVRRMILKDFFLAINEKFLGVVHRKLTAILHAVDSALVPMIQVGRVDDNTNVVDMKTAVSKLSGKFRVNEAKAAEARKEAERKRKKRSDRDRDDRMKMRGTTGGKSAKGKKRA